MTDPQNGQRGIIYVMSNPLIPGILKIGRTRRSSRERARELSRPTGVPADFEVIFDTLVSDDKMAEEEIHRLLDRVRENRAREFFRIDPLSAIQLVKEVASRYPPDEASGALGADALPQMEQRMRRWLRRDLVSLRFIQYPDLCVVRMVFQPKLRNSECHETVFDMRVFGDGTCEDEIIFCPDHNTFNQNFQSFLKLDAYSMIMTGLDILSDEAADYVAHIVEKENGDPPIELTWKVVDTQFDMWGSATSEGAIGERSLKLIHQIPDTAADDALF